MARIWTLVSLLALAANLLCILWLARLEAAGPQHIDLMLDGGAPATLYLPASADVDRGAEDRFAPILDRFWLIMDPAKSHFTS